SAACFDNRVRPAVCRETDDATRICYCGMLISLSGFASALRPLLLHRLPGDVAAARAIRPFDPIHGLIRTLLRLQHGLPHRADVQHASAIGEDAAVLCHSSGMKDFDTLDL